MTNHPARPIAAVHRFEPLAPRTLVSQADALPWLARRHAEMDGADPSSSANSEVSRRITRFFSLAGAGPENIATRGSETVTAQDIATGSLAPTSGQDGGLLKRTRFFAERAEEHFAQLYPPHSRAPEHLIHVTCTGYASPSAAQVLVDERGWHERTEVTHAYHMGCYASLPALRIAEGRLAASGASSDIVHTEICSLHSDYRAHAPEQLVVQSLFADGTIKYTLSDAKDVGDPRLELLAIRERIAPGTQDQMTWITGDEGMRMTLSTQVPRSLAKHLPGFLTTLLEGSGLSPEEARRDAVFAVHPGGPRIIDLVCESMGLRPDQVAASRSVLRERGNMSSATLPHVWDRVLRDPLVPDHAPVVSLAFGPGLTLFGALMRKRCTAG
jgi:predicted naringenin-chalcone synthase